MRGLEVPVPLVGPAPTMSIKRAATGALLLAMVLTACSPVREGPGSRDEPGRGYGDLRAWPRSAADVSGPAALSLLDQSREAAAAGRADQALSALERAVRIEPRNAFLWQALAANYGGQGLYDQAENVAQRSNSLARGNPYIELENWRVIARARQGKGDAEGARAAAERAAELQDLLED